jgi:hypothetical protein
VGTVSEVIITMISTGLPQVKAMVTTAWTYSNKMIPESPGLVASTYDDYVLFQSEVQKTNKEGSSLLDKIPANIEDSSLLDKIPDGPITSRSMLNGEDLNNLLNPNDSISVSERLLDWLALYTGSTSRLHLTSLCSYNIDTGNNGSFAFPVMAASASLSFPFKQNGNILGIYAFTPISNGKETHQMRVICVNVNNEFSSDETLKNRLAKPCFKKAAAKINMVLPAYCKVSGYHNKLAIIIHFLGWTVR